jgi:hypothetical protein
MFKVLNNMVCVVPLLLKWIVMVLSGVFRGPRSDVTFFCLLWFCIVLMSTCLIMMYFEAHVKTINIYRLNHSGRC